VLLWRSSLYFVYPNFLFNRAITPMNMNVALRLLGEIMNWEHDRATDEFKWLQFMAALKYDGYRDFVAGARFLESLVAWLRNLDPGDREAAYSLVRKKLIYIGPLELRRLVESFYPDVVHRWLVREIASRQSVSPWLVQADPKCEEPLRVLRRKILFVALSEGAHPDAVRHANPEISNEQIIVSHQVGDEKWADLVKKLRKELDDPTALFARVFLIDDFTASGTTLLRKEESCWDGKLVKFLKRVKEAEEKTGEAVFEQGWTAGVHHYIGSERARRTVVEGERAIRAENAENWYASVDFSFGYVLPEDTTLPLDEGPLRDIVDKYYDASIETSHNKVGGGDADIRFGYKACKLAVVLEHNTPNNSLPILWAESNGSKGRLMRPLFRRRQRHT
jgi:hypothetical protein